MLSFACLFDLQRYPIRRWNDGFGSGRDSPAQSADSVEQQRPGSDPLESRHGVDQSGAREIRYGVRLVVSGSAERPERQPDGSVFEDFPSGRVLSIRARAQGRWLILFLVTSSRPYTKRGDQHFCGVHEAKYGIQKEYLWSS